MKKLREARGWSQAQLATRSGLTSGYIGGIEAGHRGKRPARDVVLALARALEVEPGELLEAAGREKPDPAQHQKTFRQFVTGDPLLRQSEREMLIRLYESYVGQRRTR